MKELALRLHRWIGLATGLIVFLLSVTGAALVLAMPSGHSAGGPAALLDPPARPPVPVSRLIEAAEALSEEAPVRSVTVHTDRPGGAEVQFHDNSVAYLGLADAALLGRRGPEAGLAGWLTRAHVELLLGTPGAALVRWSTIAFVFAIALGLWLWWPSKRTLRRAFFVEARRGLKRANYDVHNVLGFYSAGLLLVLGLTGLLLAYPGLQTLGARVANRLVPSGPPAVAPGGDPAPATGDPAGDAIGGPRHPADRAWAAGLELFPEAPWQRLAFGQGSPPAARLEVGVAGDDRPGRYHRIRLGPEGEVRGVVRFGEERAAARLSRLVSELHVGSLNPAYRVAAFVACVVGASLPITGFAIWWPRWRRRRRGEPAEEPD